MHSQDSNSNMALQWTDDDKIRLNKTEVIIHQQNIFERDLDNKSLPTDIHLVEYIHENKQYSDAVRAARKVDVFDAYFDKLKEAGGGKINSIRNGFGNISPKFYSSDKKDGNK